MVIDMVGDPYQWSLFLPVLASLCTYFLCELKEFAISSVGFSTTLQIPKTGAEELPIRSTLSKTASNAVSTRVVLLILDIFADHRLRAEPRPTSIPTAGRPASNDYATRHPITGRDRKQMSLNEKQDTFSLILDVAGVIIALLALLIAVLQYWTMREVHTPPPAARLQAQP